jgi:hypothetical protein
MARKPPNLLQFTFKEALLTAVCCVAEGACVRAPENPLVCLAAVLADTRSFSVLGGQPGRPRSLGSVFAAAAIRFIGCSMRPFQWPQYHRRVIDVNVCPSFSGLAVTCDGSRLLLSVMYKHQLHVLRASDGAYLEIIGDKGAGQLQFLYPCQVWVSDDDFVFVVEALGRRVQVLTPRLAFHAFIGDESTLHEPHGVCASAEDVFVADLLARCVVVFRRGDGSFTRRFSHDRLCQPCGLAFTGIQRHVLVADGSQFVTTFRETGDVVERVQVDRFVGFVVSVACSACDELVTVSCDSYCDYGALEIWHSDPWKRALVDHDHAFRAVTMRNNTVYAYAYNKANVSHIFVYE